MTQSLDPSEVSSTNLFFKFPCQKSSNFIFLNPRAVANESKCILHSAIFHSAQGTSLDCITKSSVPWKDFLPPLSFNNTLSKAAVFQQSVHFSLSHIV